MEFHSIANIFPMLDSKSLSSLASDIKSNGLKSPILVYEGAILDGRNRFQACQAVGVSPRFETFSGTLHEALSLVWSLNFQRRHLNSSQAAIADAKRKTLDDQYSATIAAMAEAKRERPAVAQSNQFRHTHEKPSSQLIDSMEKPKDNTARTDHHRASSAGTSSSTAMLLCSLRAAMTSTHKY